MYTISLVWLSAPLGTDGAKRKHTLRLCVNCAVGSKLSTPINHSELACSDHLILKTVFIARLNCPAETAFMKTAFISRLCLLFHNVHIHTPWRLVMAQGPLFRQREMPWVELLIDTMWFGMCSLEVG